jgi:hypothetical protein
MAWCSVRGSIGTTCFLVIWMVDWFNDALWKTITLILQTISNEVYHRIFVYFWDSVLWPCKEFQLSYRPQSFQTVCFTMVGFIHNFRRQAISLWNGDGKVPRNVGILPHYYTASQLRGPQPEMCITFSGTWGTVKPSRQLVPSIKLTGSESCVLNDTKVKVKLSLCFKWAPRHEGILGEWRYSSTHSWPRY